MTGAELPPVDEVTTSWWEATRERRLVVQHCARCDHAQHPPRAVCTCCGTTEHLGWRDAGEEGVVDSCTVVERAAPGHTAPYVVARVRLPSGVLLLSNVVTDDPDDPHDPYAVAVGDRLRLAWRPLADGRALPIFQPERKA